ncbi:DUF5667 domain-containing protein [Nonomuraea sp. NEAU-A123]|uniref:DUF5667 domain-containing protein n=1 Tax=Nonomuraea sp. NEAU-A123 TaxID=2839649 RepID=UPI001BE43AAF|nr:DUF5667 domain-containing protein [Nonomuraea sp. NEAU-A123]MBT2231846.1 hypothetical protein [Nonomuraea sp. NEAU-A123]
MGRGRRSRERVLGHLTELRRLPLGGGPAAAFRERLRAELLSAHPALLSADPVRRPARRSRRRPARRLSWLSQVATFGLTAAMMLSAFATYQALPGDTLYPLKRAAESTLVRLSTDDVQRAERELISAKTRASEVDRLLGSSGDGPLVTKTLTEMEESTRSGISRLERAEPRSPKINRFARDQKNMVEPMLERMDGDQQDKATGYLDYIDGLVAPR